MRSLAFAILLVAAALPARAADKWLRLETANFELFSSADEKSARDTILYFEQVRSFFIRAAPVKFPGEFPVRIIVFKDRDEFNRYSANNIEIAYYAAGGKRDYIVMAGASPDTYSIAVHEYMHLIIRHSGLHIPVWLNEGLADVYSSLRPVKDGVAVGDLIPGRMQVLLTGRWLTFDSLTSADTRSSVYNEADRVGAFYAESWALAHMLFLSPEYRKNFGAFVMALNAGKSTAEACQIAYNRPSAQVFKDLQKYIGGDKFYGRIFQTQLAKSESQPEVLALTEFNSRLMLADLLVATGRFDRAKAEYRQLEQLQPGQAEVTQSLGYFALAEKDIPQARQYFEKAFAAGETDPQMCLRLAILDREANQPAAKIVAALERAIHSKPDYTDARVQLGLTKVQLRDFPSAIDTLMGIDDVTPTQATPLFSGLAYAYLELGDVESARRNIQTARKWIATPQETAGVQQLSDLIEARAEGAFPPHPGEKLARAEGILQFVECSAGSRQIDLMQGTAILSFQLPDVKEVEVTHTGSGPGNLTCGHQQSLPMIVEYAANASGKTIGVVRRLVFMPQ